MSLNWRTAFFVQAKSDYDLLLFLEHSENVPLCHMLHYLQMVTEKLAKGFNAGKKGCQQPQTIHPVFARFVQKQAKQNATLRRACYFSKQEPYSRYLESLLPIAKRIEDLAPRSDASSPNTEYPWAGIQAVSGDETRKVLFAPAQYGFPELDLQNSQMRKLMGFIQACFQVIMLEIER